MPPDALFYSTLDASLEKQHRPGGWLQFHFHLAVRTGQMLFTQWLPSRSRLKFRSGKRYLRIVRQSGRMQKELPLEIVYKGRFDKSEPTIRHGEDLDLPTYIRKGVALN
jgi:hypothetical protein